VLVEERYGDVGIGDALYEGHAENARGGGFWVRAQQSVSARDEARHVKWVEQTFVIVLFRGPLAELPPPRGQIPTRRGRFWGSDGGGLGLAIARARSVGIGVRACGRHGRLAR
jgi:hypothetical protein